MKNLEYNATLLENDKITHDTHILTFHVPGLAGSFQPGQFLEVDCQGYIFRPFGLMLQNIEDESIKIGVKIVGERSEILSSYEIGRKVRIIGPLGHGFTIDGYEQIIAVGGGSGIFPLFETLHRAEQKSIVTHFICGFRSKEDAFPLDTFSTLGSHLFLSSDQGGLDYKGHAGSALEYYYPRIDINLKTLLIACGPTPMLRFIKNFSEKTKLDCQLSLEENMACGLGICTGCVVDVLRIDGQVDRARCCVEGPVFNAEILLFDKED